MFKNLINKTYKKTNLVKYKNKAWSRLNTPLRHFVRIAVHILYYTPVASVQ